MTELRLFIDADWPHAHTSARWYLCQPGGAVMRYGRSEPRHWPGVRPSSESGEADKERAEEPRQPCSVILTGGQVACQRIRLPRGKAGRQPAILAAALEDRLLAEPDECLFLPGEADEDRTTPVFILGKERLRNILSLLEKLGLDILSVWSDGQLLPEVEGVRVARLEKGLLKVPEGREGVLALDLFPEQVFPEAVVQLVPDSLITLTAEGSDPNLPARSGLNVLAEMESPDRFPLASSPGLGFLIGEFAPPGIPLAALRPLRPALHLVGGFAVVLAAVFLAQWGWLGYQSRQYRIEAENIFRAAFPGAAVVDPVLQMQRQLDERRRVAGQLGSNDLLAQLAASLESGMRLWGFDYAGGRLELDVSLPQGAEISLLGRLDSAGYKVQVSGRQLEGSNMRAKISVQGGLR